MLECCVRSPSFLSSFQRLLSHQEAGPGSQEDHEIPAALPTQVLILCPVGFCPATSPDLLVSSNTLSLCRMRELKQNQELEGLPQPGLAT